MISRRPGQHSESRIVGGTRRIHLYGGSCSPIRVRRGDTHRLARRSDARRLTRPLNRRPPHTARPVIADTTLVVSMHKSFIERLLTDAVAFILVLSSAVGTAKRDIALVTTSVGATEVAALPWADRDGKR